MKKAIFILAVVLAFCAFSVEFFSFPAKALAAEQATWAKPAVVALNKANVSLAEKIGVLLKRNNLSAIEVYDEVDEKTVVVSNDFSPLFAKELIRELNGLSSDEEKSVELAMALADYNRVLRRALDKLKATSGKK